MESAEFFGIMDTDDTNELLLMQDYGIYYEFIPMESFDGVNSKEIVNLEGVQPDVNYAMVISTNGGLWRYILGDTIQFTSVLPYRFKISGRTKSYLNTFGEEVIVENAEKAVAYACMKTNAQIREYTASPVYMTSIDHGAHEWLFEFVHEPDDLNRFAFLLDEHLREINSDYDAKRYNNMILNPPIVKKVNEGTFDNWLKSIGKLGGQNKVPRLSNNRVIMEQILQTASHQKTIIGKSRF